MAVKVCNKYRKANLAREKVLGMGQPGTVTYLCKDEQMQEDFACKSIPTTRLRTHEDVDKVKRELAIMEHLPEHVNIVSLYNAFMDEHALHLVMELCEGGELFCRIAVEGRALYTEPQSSRLMRTIMEVVQTCHRHEVKHRDLKPENFVFVDKSEESSVKVIDFGMLVFFEPGQRFYDILGTPAYMAPEIWKGRGYGPEVDVWNTGIILYLMLSQDYPFEGETTQGISWEIRHGKLDLERHPWPMVSDLAKLLVWHMLERDPVARYTAEEVLNHLWLQEERVEEKC